MRVAVLWRSKTAMDLIVTVIVGALAGWLAGGAVGPLTRRTGPEGPGRPGGRMAQVLLGVVGAVLGNWAAGVLGLASEGSPARWFIAFMGAVVLVAAARVLLAVRSARSA